MALVNLSCIILFPADLRYFLRSECFCPFPFCVARGLLCWKVFMRYLRCHISNIKIPSCLVLFDYHFIAFSHENVQWRAYLYYFYNVIMLTLAYTHFYILTVEICGIMYWKTLYDHFWCFRNWIMWVKLNHILPEITGPII